MVVPVSSRRPPISVIAIVVAAVAACVLLTSASARPSAGANVGWLGFGNTPDEVRHSPLTEITKGNVSKLGRLFTVDFHAIDASIRRGEQSYPVESNGTLYVTTNDDSVFALNATTGAVKWRWTPDNVAVFRNFGIVANRGVALCDGHVFILTLDMTIASLDAATGKLERRVPIAEAVPGASSSYGYSETSAPICANHRLVIGAAGSEYGVRGFVMAYHTDLTPAWPNPFWTIPPAGTQWRRYGTLVGGGVVWTPTTGGGGGGPPRPSTRRRTRSTSAPARPPRSTSRRFDPARTREQTRSSPSIWQAADSSGGSSRWRTTSGRTTLRSRPWSTTRRPAARRHASSRWRPWKGSGSRTTRLPGGLSTSA
jgi:hypothetical protein